VEDEQRCRVEYEDVLDAPTADPAVEGRDQM
jgi:hypothetical protein